MAILDFPPNPQPGDTYTGDNNITYTYDGVKWTGRSNTLVTGYTGSIGYTGSASTASGYTGSFGISGTIGPFGYTGSQGDVGYTGSEGYIGSKGDAGGYTGSQGDVGYTGSEGYTGSLGYTGSEGYTGSQGDVGYTGSEGYIGSKGDAGGYTGSRGDVGYTGSEGYTGSLGYTGSVGYTGSLGYTGSEGYIGSKGDLGYTGSAGLSLVSIDELTDVIITSPTLTGQTLKFDGLNWINNQFEIQDDGTPMLGGDLDLNNFNITGDGNLRITGEINTSNIVATVNTVRLTHDPLSSAAKLLINSQNSRSSLQLTRTNIAEDLSDPSITYGSVFFERHDINGSLTPALISGRGNAILIGADPTGIFNEDTFVTQLHGTNGANLGIRTWTPTEALDVRGNAIVTGFVQFGSYTDTGRNALTPAVGMVIYNTTANKFQGYQNTSGTTLQWVDLS